MGIVVKHWGIEKLLNLKIHLDGDDPSTFDLRVGTNFLEEWRGKSGTVINCTQSSEALQPVYNPSLINGRGGFTFINAQRLNFLSDVLGQGDSPYTFILIGTNYNIDINSSFMFYSFGNGTNKSLFMRRAGNILQTGWGGNNLPGGTLDSNPKSLVTWYDQNERRQFINNIQQANDFPVDKEQPVESFCTLGSGGSDMDVAEFIYCEGSLSVQDLLNVQNYITKKYGVL